MKITTRDATEADAAFIAWVQLAAARGHCDRGFFDLAFTSRDEELLEDIVAIVTTQALSFHHWSRFRIAEVDGQPAAALSGYEPAQAGDEELILAYGEAAETRGWGESFFAEMGPRITPLTDCMVPTPDNFWVVEWVATLPEYRGRGLVGTLLKEMLERGRRLHYQDAQISIMVGNIAAQRSYESAGFEVFDQKTSARMNEALGTPGICRLRRTL